MGFTGPDPSASDAEAVLAHLELTVTRRLSGLLSGDFRGLLPGTGSELADTRRYEPGDDVRRIDWAATARSASTQLRTTVEDRELTCYLVVDASRSMDFGTHQTSKRHLAAAAAASWGFLAARGANRVGGAVVGTFTPAGAGALAPRLLAVFAFLLLMHYAVWMWHFPKVGAAERASFESTAVGHALRGWRLVALGVAGSGVVAALAVWDYWQGRAVYASLAAYHAYLEYPVLLALLVAPRLATGTVAAGRRTAQSHGS